MSPYVSSLLFGTAAILAAACSNSSPAHDAGGGQGTGGAAGSSTSPSTAPSGAGNSGSAGNGGGAGSNTTGPSTGSGTQPHAEANRVCRAAMTAGIERSSFCFGYDVSAGRTLDACPDYYFNTDSYRDVATVAACLAQLEKRPCSELALNVIPECLPGGKRPAGAGCTFHSQCQGSICEGAGLRACGTCRDGNLALGQTCERFQCRPGDYCDESTHKCVSKSTFVYASEGESCLNSQTSTVLCQGDLICTNVGKTVALACQKLVIFPNCGNRRCDPGYYCRRSDTDDCVQAAKLGEACVDEVSNGLPPCLPDLLCWKGKCAKRRLAGESCDADQPCSEYADCVNGLCRVRDCPAQK